MQINEFPMTRGSRLIIERLRSRGYLAYAVGGAVRDFIMGREYNDIDITTNALPDEVTDVFSDMRVIDTGIKHGTVTVVCLGEPTEITTFRADGKYSDGRRPDSISFVRTLKEDLARRDFTMNAVCYGPGEGYIDMFGGIADISGRTIRAIGDPETRFTEDALRILRAARFSAQLEFYPEERTLEAAVSCRALLRSVSAERICAEWMKLVGAPGAPRALSVFSPVIAEFLPEAEPVCRSEYTKQVFDSLGVDPAFRTGALFAMPVIWGEKRADKAVYDFRSGAARLRFDRKSALAGEAIVLGCSRSTASLRDALRLASEIGVKEASACLRIMAAAGSGDPGLAAELEQAVANGTCISISSLAVNGDDLMKLGMRGREIGNALTAMLGKVIDGEIENSRAALLGWCRKHYPQDGFSNK